MHKHKGVLIKVACIMFVIQKAQLIMKVKQKILTGLNKYIKKILF